MHAPSHPQLEFIEVDQLTPEFRDKLKKIQRLTKKPLQEILNEAFSRGVSDQYLRSFFQPMTAIAHLH